MNPRWSVFATGLVAVASIARAGVTSLELVALSGRGAPDAGAARFAGFSDALLNDSGHVLFWAKLTGDVTSGTDSGLWSTRSGSLRLVTRESTAAVQDPDRTIDSLEGPSFSGRSDVAFTGAYLGDLTAPQTKCASFFELASDPGIVQRFAADLSGVLTTNTLVVSPLVALSDDGTAATSGASARGLSLLSNRSLLLDGTSLVPPASGVPEGATFRRIEAPVTNAGGDVVFRAMAGTSASASSWVPVLCAYAEGTTLAAAGGQVPGAVDGQVYVDFASAPSVAGSCVAFWASLAGNGAPAGGDSAIIRLAPGASGKVVQAGQPAPGAPIAAFASFDRNIALDSNGTVMFIGYLLGGGAPRDRNSGIWMSRVGVPTTLMVREDDPAPGTTGRFATFSSLIGTQGRFAFAATLRGSGITGGNSQAVYTFDWMGGLTKVIQTGDAVAMPTGPDRTVRHFDFVCGQSESGRSAINGAGAIALRLVFTDNSEAIVIARAACPADVNGDGGLDGADLEAFSLAYEAFDPAADIDGNGTVDPNDLTAFFDRWGTGSC